MRRELPEQPTQPATDESARDMVEANPTGSSTESPAVDLSDVDVRENPASVSAFTASQVAELRAEDTRTAAGSHRPGAPEGPEIPPLVPAPSPAPYWHRPTLTILFAGLLFFLGVAPLVLWTTIVAAFATVSALALLQAPVVALRPRFPRFAFPLFELALTSAVLVDAVTGYQIVEAGVSGQQRQLEAVQNRLDVVVYTNQGLGRDNRLQAQEIRALRDQMNALSQDLAKIDAEVRKSISDEDLRRIVNVFVQALSRSTVVAGAVAPPLTETAAPFRAVGVSLDSQSPCVGDTVLITVRVRNISTSELAITPDPLVRRPIPEPDEQYYAPVALSGTRITFVLPGQDAALPSVPMRLNSPGTYVIYSAAATETQPYRSLSDENWFNTYWRNPLEVTPRSC